MINPTLAPPARFRSCRVSIGKFASSGSRDDLRRGIGHYFKGGQSGSGNAVRRFGATTNTAGRLYRTLEGLSSGGQLPPDILLDRSLLSGKSVSEIRDLLVEAVRPIDGSQDAEANARALNEALVLVLEHNPNADLLNLSEADRLTAVQEFIAMDVFLRICLDIGQTLKEKATTTSIYLRRRGEIKEYVRAAIAAAFRKVTSNAKTVAQSDIRRIVQSTLHNAIDVFQEYIT